MRAPVRFSSLVHMGRSPAHYLHALLHPVEPTPAMRVGTAAHAHVLGAWKDVAVWEGGRRVGREWDAFSAAQAGREIVNQEEYDRGRAISDAVCADPHAAALLARATIREQELAWSIAGRACMGRPDAFGDGVLVDLKITHDASERRFPWHAIGRGWCAQPDWYAQGLAANGHTIDAAYLIAVEARPPHVVQVWEVTPAALVMGAKTWRLWWEQLMQCEASDAWPGYSLAILPLEPPEDFGEVALSIGGEEVEL
jgi:hypothetical protein